MTVARELPPGPWASRTTMSLMFVVLLLLAALVGVTYHYSRQLSECRGDLYTYEKGPGKYLYMEPNSTILGVAHNLSQVHPIQVNIDGGGFCVGPACEPH